MKQRDLTEAQFQDALKRSGLYTYGFMGYVDRVGDTSLGISAWNGGNTRRAQLAYIIREFDKHPAACLSLVNRSA